MSQHDGADDPKAREQRLFAAADRVLMKNYRQQPVIMERGAGCELWDVTGRRYLDLTAGIAVCCLGHSHPALRDTLAEQAGRLQHVSNLYFIEQQILAAEALVERCFADRIFFCNSGAEANEAAIKLARRYQRVVAGRNDRDLVVSTSHSFHGRSVATVAVTGQPKYHEEFGPLLQPVEFVPFGDLDAARRVLSPASACAFIVEPIQAEGGIVVPPAGYLRGLRELCDETGTLLIFDEVQTGIGRTGRWFGYEHEDVTPDVMTLAKALGGGAPIGAVAASEGAARGLAFEGGAVPHASTFGGNPLACAAALAVIRTIEAEGLIEHAARVGEHLGGRLAELAERYERLCDGSRGRGLLRGLVLRQPAAPVVAACRERGVLLSVAGGTVVRFVPALNVSTEQIDEGIAVLDQVLAEQEI